MTHARPGQHPNAVAAARAWTGARAGSGEEAARRPLVRAALALPSSSARSNSARRCSSHLARDARTPRAPE